MKNKRVSLTYINQDNSIRKRAFYRFLVGAKSIDKGYTHSTKIVFEESFSIENSYFSNSSDPLIQWHERDKEAQGIAPDKKPYKLYSDPNWNYYVFEK